MKKQIAILTMTMFMLSSQISFAGYTNSMSDVKDELSVATDILDILLRPDPPPPPRQEPPPPPKKQKPHHEKPAPKPQPKPAPRPVSNQQQPGDHHQPHR